MLTVMLACSGGPVILLWVSQGSYKIVYSSNLENKKGIALNCPLVPKVFLQVEGQR